MRDLRFILSLVCIVSFGVAIAAKKNDNASALQLCQPILSDKSEAQIIAELEKLLKEIDVNAQDAQGRTVLMAAIEKGSLALVDYLVTNGADIEKKDVDGQTALEIAYVLSQDDAASYLLAIDQFKKGGWTGLDFGNSDLIKFFVGKKKFDVNAKDNSGKTVLMYAIEGGGIDLITYLVEQGANINAVNNDGKTVLMLAVEHASEFVTYLLGKGADPDIKDKTGKTALMNAIMEKPSEKFFPRDAALISLIPKSTNLDLPIPGQEGRTVLMEAAKYGRKHIVKKLLESGANVNAVDENGNTPLFYVAKYGKNISLGQKTDLFIYAFLETVDLLINHHANLDIFNDSGQTALIEVSKNVHERKNTIFQGRLLEKGADPDIQDNEGKTALMWAAGEKSLDFLIGSLKAIVEVGADLDITDKNGKTALVIAQEAGNVEAAEYLKKMSNDLAHKQKVAERKKRKKEKKEAGLLLAERKEQELLKNFTEALKALA